MRCGRWTQRTLLAGLFLAAATAFSAEKAPATAKGTGATAEAQGTKPLLRSPTRRATTTTTKAPAASGATATSAPAAPPPAAPVDTAALRREAGAEDPTAPARVWRTWDDGASDRAKEARFRLSGAIRSGSLSLADTRALMTKERKVSALTAVFQGEGKPDAGARTRLKQALADASAFVFANAKEPARLNASLLRRLDSEEFAAADGQEVCEQVKRLFELYRALSSNQPIGAEQRGALGREYDLLAATLHE